MNKIMLTTVISAFLVGGCAAYHKYAGLPKIQEVLKEQTGQNGRACVRTADIRGYGHPDGVISINGGREYFLATTLTRCHEMKSAVAASFEGMGGHEICGGGGSRVNVQGASCIISHIFEFENRKAAFAALEVANNTIDELKKAVDAAAETDKSE